MLVTKLNRQNHIVNKQFHNFIKLPSKQQILQKKEFFLQKTKGLKMPTFYDLKEAMEDNIKRLKLVYKDVRTFVQIRPKIKQFNSQLKRQDYDSFIDLGDHQKYYFLQKDLIKFVPIYIIIVLPMTCFILPYYIYKFPHMIPSQFQYETLINEFLEQQKRDYYDSKKYIVEQSYKFNASRIEDLQFSDFLHVVKFLKMDVKLNYSDLVISMALQIKGKKNDQNNINQYKQKLIMKQMRYELDLMCQQDFLVQRHQNKFSSEVIDEWLARRGFEKEKHSRNQYIYQLSCQSDDVDQQVRKYIQAYLQ